MGRLALAALVVPALALGVAAAAPPRGPSPLRGVPLGSSTGLRLLVADKPPFVLDVDTGRRTPVAGMRAEESPLGVVPVGGRAAVVVVNPVAEAPLYSVRDGGRTVVSLGTGTDVVPAADGRSVWIKSRADADSCTIRLVDLDGRVLRGPGPFACATTIYPGGSLGIVVNRTRIVDPLRDTPELATRWGVVAATGTKLVLAGPGKRFTLRDAATGAERLYPWPSILYGQDAPAVDPRGRLVAVGFADPAWYGSGAQVEDVWTLDTQSGTLKQLPGMPAFVRLKFTSMTWTDDGRLVFLGEHMGGTAFVAVWRPGWKRLAVKNVRLGRSGGDAFAPLGS